jgi:hypothetical protein
MSDYSTGGPENRGDIMRRDAYILGIASLAIVNGMHFSYYYIPAYFLMRPFVQITFFTGSPLIASYLTSLLLSTITIMMAGVPAAIYERVRGLKQSDATTYTIWLGASVLLALPTIVNLASSQ